MPGQGPVQRTGRRAVRPWGGAFACAGQASYQMRWLSCGLAAPDGLDDDLEEGRGACVRTGWPPCRRASGRPAEAGLAAGAGGAGTSTGTRPGWGVVMFRAMKSMSSILPLKMQIKSLVPVSSRLKTRCRLWPALAEVQLKEAWLLPS